MKHDARKWVNSRRSNLTVILAAAIVFLEPAASIGQEIFEQGIEAYVSEDALQALYTRPLEVAQVGSTNVRVGFFFNEQRDLVGIADMLVQVGTPGRLPRWSFLAGARGYGAFLVEGSDVFAAGVGGAVRYAIPFFTDGSTAVVLSGFYSPDILTFGDADDVKDVTVRIETRLRPATYFFVGYRSFEWSLTLEDREVDDGLHIGIRSSF